MKKSSFLFDGAMALAVITTLVFVTMYVAFQQSIRLSANDNQVQLAEYSANLLAQGLSPQDATGPVRVEIARDLVPYMMVYSATDTLLSTDATLNGAAPTLPSGVLDAASTTGETRITWEPEQGVRSAIVVVPYNGANPGFVVVGKSLRESESLDTEMFSIIFIAWIISLAYIFALPYFLEFVNDMHRR